MQQNRNFKNCKGRSAKWLFSEARTPGDQTTWTLATILGDLIDEAESLFGHAEDGWTLLGVEFWPFRPQIWYPGHGKRIAIRLSGAASNDLGSAIFELAHEVIHVLGPSRLHEVSVLEEGLADHFSKRVCSREGFAFRLPAEHQLALELFENFISAHPNGIRALREANPRLSAYTSDPDSVSTIIPGIDKELATRLCEPFNPQPSPT